MQPRYDSFSFQLLTQQKQLSSFGHAAEPLAELLQPHCQSLKIGEAKTSAKLAKISTRPLATHSDYEKAEVRGSEVSHQRGVFGQQP